MNITQKDYQFIKEASAYLENPSLFIKLCDILGKPIDFAIARLPAPAREKINRGTQKALEKALDLVIDTLEANRKIKDFDELQGKFGHKLTVVITGLLGGAGGIGTTLLELPVSTCIMLRSIADIASQMGEDLTDPNSKLECLAVFFYGSRSTADDAAENTYFAMRALLAKTISEAAAYLAGKSVPRKTAPVLVRLIATIAERFGITVTAKAAAQAVPVIGAVTGAAINAAFINHFQKVAEYHFGLRRLERKYGKKLLEETYKKCLAKIN